VKYVLIFASFLATSACGTRGMAPGQPSADSKPIPPSMVLNFASLYAQNCAACHGASGGGGAAIGLADPVYLTIADDATIKRITSAGVPGTAMPAFARSSGGMLTDDQIDAIVHGIRTHWARPDALRGAHAPPYATGQPGDPQRGATVYATFCSSCHGPDGRGGSRASSIVDASYLALVSDQDLRTTVISGRPDLGAPDWRGNVPGKPMSAQDVSDVVAWLAAQRPGLLNRPDLSAQIPGGAQ
jgi:cytochrome c oxidase cbb3-type subunit 3